MYNHRALEKWGFNESKRKCQSIFLPCKAIWKTYDIIVIFYQYWNQKIFFYQFFKNFIQPVITKVNHMHPNVVICRLECEKMQTWERTQTRPARLRNQLDQSEEPAGQLSTRTCHTNIQLQSLLPQHLVSVWHLWLCMAINKEQHLGCGPYFRPYDWNYLNFGPMP